MNGVKVTFEFQTSEGFAKETFEKAVKQEIQKAGLHLDNFWCVLGRQVFLREFPVAFFVNECIIEIRMNEGMEPNWVCTQLRMLLEDLSENEKLYFSLGDLSYDIVKIKKEDTTCDSKNGIRVFVTGVTGQLGHDVMNCLYERGYQGIGSGHAEKYNGVQDGTPVTAMPYIPLDITDLMNIKKLLYAIKPDVVIHCAAWNAVDQAENKKNEEMVRFTNTEGTQTIAKVCAEINAKMVYISTDYVFDGSGEEPWGADSKGYGALNVYGQSKLKGELAVSNTLDKYFIVRTSWAYGINGENFVKSMLRLGRKSASVRVVDDQIGTPTYMRDLASLLVDMIGTERYGYYNATNEGGYISWYTFACEIYRQAGIETQVIPVNSKEYGYNIASRPFNSRLDNSKLAENGFQLLPDWKDALKRYLKELKDFGMLKT